MAQIIKSMSDLKKILESRIQKALEMTQDEIWETVQEHIDAYYDEYEPKRYLRSFKFMSESLIRTKVVKNGTALSCTMEIDPDYLHYTYPGGYATGLGVVMEANRGSHGGVYDDDFGHFWDDAMQDLGLKPGILAIMKDNLKKCGVPVK